MRLKIIALMLGFLILASVILLALFWMLEQATRPDYRVVVPALAGGPVGVSTNYVEEVGR